MILTIKVIYEWQSQIKRYVFHNGESEQKLTSSRHIRPGVIHLQVYHGANRSMTEAELKQADVVLTTYDTLRSDYANARHVLVNYNWARIILDEGLSNNSSESLLL